MSVVRGGDTAHGEMTSVAQESKPVPPMGGAPITARATDGRRTLRGRAARVAFVGLTSRLEDWAPSGPCQPFQSERFAIGPRPSLEQALAELRAFQGDVVVVLDPASLEPAALEHLPGTTLGVLPKLPAKARATACAKLDRLVCFDPALTGTEIGGQEIWRAVPPPVSDALFQEGQRSPRPRRAIAIGASTPHREAMLMPAKHHHDVLQVIHGIDGQALRELLDEHGVGIHVNQELVGGFDWSVGLHLAAGQLLLSESLHPAHGLEVNLDYLRFESPEDLVLMLDRLAMFPEMHARTQIRGRVKAETFRSSRIFGRLIHDLLLDVAAFGRRREGRSG